MPKFMVMLQVNPKADDDKISQLTRALGMQTTTRSLDQVKVLVFEGNTRGFYRMKSRLESEKFNDYFTLVDIGQATSFELEALSDEGAIDPKKAWRIREWLQNGISELANLVDNWQERNLSVGIAMGEKTNQKIITKILRIAGQNYELRIIHRPEDGENHYFFELHSAVPGGRIPGGFKLRLLTEDMEEWQGNYDEAQKARDFLRVAVKKVEQDDGIIWETTPLPDNYYPQPFWF